MTTDPRGHDRDEVGIPSVTRLDSVEAVLAGEPHGAIRVQRLVTQNGNGSNLVFGLLEMDAGSSASWSFEREDPKEAGVRYWGPAHEVYFIIRGRIRVDWEGNSLVAGPNDVVHFATGHRYICTVLGDDTLVAVYAMAPPPF